MNKPCKVNLLGSLS